MSIYRGIVHYYFKKGWEEKGIKYLEVELFKAAHEYGNHHFDIYYDEKNPGHVMGTSIWNTFDEAHRFQEMWQRKEKEIMEHMTKEPMREFYKLRKSMFEKSKKVA
jgi:quinol monooxygenase YgiN